MQNENSNISDLFARREINGLRVALAFKAGFAGIFLVAGLGAAASRIEMLLTTGVASGAILFAIAGLYLLSKGHLSKLIGWFNLLFSLAIVVAMPFIWYHSVGGEQVPRTYMPKTYLATIVMALLILDSFTLRPLYPFLLSLGIAGNYVFMLWYASQDPRFELGDDYVRSVLGPQLHLPTYLINILATILMGGALSFFADRTRRVALEAATHEVESLQLSRYFSPRVAERLRAANQDFFLPGGKLQKVAVLFSDIEGFTAFSESRSPEEVIRLLTDYHKAMVAAIFEQGGTLDKFIGDAIMATFGSPETRPDDTSRAFRSGLAMNAALAALNQERQAIGQPPIKHRIGIHSGLAIAGNIGSANRLEYTVIGDTVNTASRIESLCKDLKTNFLVSEQLYEELTPSERKLLSPVGNQPIKGKKESIALYTLQ